MSNLTDEQIKLALDTLWDSYPSHVRFNLPFMVSTACSLLGSTVGSYGSDSQKVIDYIKANYVIVIGKDGGVMRPNIPVLVKDVVTSPTSAAVNNHICPCCGNDKVSKTERSCWKCGGNLH